MKTLLITVRYENYEDEPGKIASKLMDLLAASGKNVEAKTLVGPTTCEITVEERPAKATT